MLTKVSLHYSEQRDVCMQSYSLMLDIVSNGMKASVLLRDE